MNISHIIRGADHKENTYKHVALFEAFGVPTPVFAHIPLILKTSGPGKMSKRDKGALVEEYREKGTLPKALVNFLSLLGWNPKNDREIMEISEIVERFDLPGINKDNARFDEKKLAHFNTEHMRKLEIGSYTWLARPFLEKAGLVTDNTEETYLQEVLALCQEKIRSFDDLPKYTHYFFKEEFGEDAVAREKVFKNTPEPLARLAEWASVLKTLPDSEWTDAGLEAALQTLCAQTGKQTSEYIHITRLALSGTNVGPAFYGLIRVLGKERVLARIARYKPSE